MLTFSISAVNSEFIAAESVELKFLVSGHTFLSSDSAHHQIEQELQKHGDVYD